MCPASQLPGKPLGVNISGPIGIVEGDIIGGNKIIHGLTPDELATVISKIMLPFRTLSRRSRDFDMVEQRMFFDQVEPTFVQMRAVIKSYEDDIMGFRESLRNAIDFRSARLGLLEYIEKRRRTVQQRTELVAVLEATLGYWQEKSNNRSLSSAETKLIEFIEALSNYFIGLKYKFNDRDTYVEKRSYLTRRQVSENLFIDRGEEMSKWSSVGTTIIDISSHLLHFRHTESADIGGPEALDHSIKPILEVIDLSISPLEDRSKTLFKKYHALKLECSVG